MYSNTDFVPLKAFDIKSGSANIGEMIKPTSNDVFYWGIYNYANSDRDAACAEEAVRVFGVNLIPAKQRDLSALCVGNAIITRSGCEGNPEAYYRAKGWTVPKGYGDYTNLIREIGSRELKVMRDRYDSRKAEIDAAKAAPVVKVERAPREADAREAAVFAGGFLALLVLLVLVMLFVLRAVEWFGNVRRGVAEWNDKNGGVFGYVATKTARPEAMRSLFFLAVAALVLIALCLVVIACVLVF